MNDKKNPKRLAKLSLEQFEHIWACVFDCEYAYGAGGAIVDLSKPAGSCS